MARTLKTFVTNLGFFELAVAAPSMKAALDAWGFGKNAFHNDFAWQTEDPKIIAAATASPGVVLKRPVGSKGEFTENAELPSSLPASAASSRPPPKTTATSKVKKPATARTPEKTERASIISFAKEKARRDAQRAKQAAAEKRDKAKRDRAVGKAQADLDQATKHHEQILNVIERDREKIERRQAAEDARWRAQREKLQAAITHVSR